MGDCGGALSEEVPEPEPRLVTVEIDLEQVQSLRTRMPVQAHRRFTEVYTGYRSNRKCSTCGQVGHTRQFCPEMTVADRDQIKSFNQKRTEGATTYRQKCFNCKEVGHWAKDCPQPARKGSKIQTKLPS